MASSLPTELPLAVTAKTETAMSRTPVRVLTVLLAIVAVGLSLSAASGYYAIVATNLAITLLLTLSLHLVVGFLGLFSLAHGAFFGTAAYLSAILAKQLGVSPWLCLPLSVGGAVAVAVIIGLPALRLKGFYLAVATLSFGLFVEAFTRQATDITGGAYGISDIPALTFMGTPLRGDGMLVLAVGTLLLVMLVMDNIMNSRLGQAFIATRDNELAAAAAGIDVAKVRLVGFALSAAVAGIAGWLQTFTHLIVNPFLVGVDTTFLWFFMILVGGLGSVAGVVLGTVLLSLGPEMLGFASSQQILLSGLIMLLVVLFAPRGLGGVVDLVLRRVLRQGNPA